MDYASQIMEGMKMTLEKKIETKTCKYAKKYGFLTPKVSVVSETGWPDRLFINIEAEHFWVEFKQEGKPLQPIQEYRCDNLLERGALVFVIDLYEDGEELVDAMESARISDEGYKALTKSRFSWLNIGPGTREN